MSQTAYNQQTEGLDGQKSEIGPSTVRSYAAEGAAGIEFGRFVSLGTDKEEQVILPGLAADITSIKSKRGVALKVHTKESPNDGNAPKYKEKETVSVMVKGAVYVKVEDAVDPTDDVYVNWQNGDEGLFRSDTAAGDAAQLADARWIKGADAGGFALLELL